MTNAMPQLSSRTATTEPTAVAWPRGSTTECETLMSEYALYWGDLHSHCAISYGHGTVEQALARARQQLDFCSVTGHAFWPDMPTDRDRYADIIDYHHTGFGRLANNWSRLLNAHCHATDASFVGLPSYEWHSLKYGDHNVYTADPDLPLVDAPDLPGLRAAVKPFGGLAIPHHIGYAAGYRGIDWDHFDESVSPFVEVFSLHGCSVDEHAPYPMLHDMGPRDFGSTAEAGWNRGHRFGIVGGTDHHAAYPGSHGDGRMGVYAAALTRDALMEAFVARRVFAATGDRIDPRLKVDDADIGSEITAPNTRRINVAVRAIHTIDQVKLIKNSRLLAQWFPTGNGERSSRKWRLRLTWGWGRNTERHEWNGRLVLSEGVILRCDPCFSGMPVVSPQADCQDQPDLPHAITDQEDRTVSWRSVTSGNPSMRHGATQSLSLELDAPADSTIDLEVNGQRLTYSLQMLLNAGRSHYMRGWLSEAIRVGPVVPIEDCAVDAELLDEPEQAVDRYRLEVRLTNGQCAWTTPIWATR